MFFCSCVPVLPDGVIGNTWAFGAYIPGSSPGRVVLKFIPDGSGSSIFIPDGSGSPRCRDLRFAATSILKKGRKICFACNDGQNRQ